MPVRLYASALLFLLGIQTSIAGGLLGEYFNNRDLTGFVVSRTDAQINFDWGDSAPASGVDPDTFSVRWTGRVKPRFSQTYTFHATTDDGVRLWINGQLIL